MKLRYAYLISIFVVILTWSNYFTYDFVSASVQLVRDSSTIHYLLLRSDNLKDIQEQSIWSKILDVLSKCVTVVAGMVLLVITPTLNMYGKMLRLWVMKHTSKK